MDHQCPQDMEVQFDSPIFICFIVSGPKRLEYSNHCFYYRLMTVLIIISFSLSDREPRYPIASRSKIVLGGYKEKRTMYLPTPTYPIKCKTNKLL